MVDTWQSNDLYVNECCYDLCLLTIQDHAYHVLDSFLNFADNKLNNDADLWQIQVLGFTLTL